MILIVVFALDGAASHPDSTYTADSMQPGSGGVWVTGGLTVRGRTRPLSFDAKVSAAAGEVRLDAEVPVNRADFGLTYGPMRMAPMNSTIVIHAVFTRPQAHSATSGSGHAHSGPTY